MRKKGVLLMIVAVSILGIVFGWRLRHTVNALWRGAVVSIERCEQGSAGPVLHLRSLSANHVNVVGMRASCSCIAVEKFPISIAPLQTIAIEFREQPPEGATVEFFVDQKSDQIAWVFD